MSGRRNKYTFFIFGLFMGALIGGSFVWWQKGSLQKSDYVDRIKSFFSTNSDSLKNPSYSQYAQKKIKGPEENNHKKHSNDSALTIDSAFLSDPNNGFTHANSNDSTPNISNTDTGSTVIYTSYESVVVAKDELLVTESYKIKGFEEEISETSNKIDSVLLGYSEKNNGSLNVEFWKSPVNYRGYKREKDKLVLFGIYQMANVRFIYLNGLYLNYNTEYYILENTSKFKPLLPITNKKALETLSKL